MIKHEKAFAVGLLFIVIGGCFAMGAFSYALGDARRMGPGFFPTLLGVLLMILGIISLAGAVNGTRDAAGRIDRTSLRAMVFVAAAVVAFGVLVTGLPRIGLPSMGLAVAIIATVLLASFPGSEFRLTETLVLAALLCAFVYAVFIVALDMPFRMWPWFAYGG